MRSAHFLCLVFFVAPWDDARNVFAQDSVEASRLVSCYSQSNKNFEHVKFEATVRTIIDSPQMPRGTVVADSQYTVVRDGDKWKVKSKEDIATVAKGMVIRDRSIAEYLVRGFRARVVVPADASANPFVFWKVGAQPDKELTILAGQPFAVATYGILPGNASHSLAEVLRQAPIVARKRAVAGTVWELQGTNTWGKLTVWVDEARGCLPLRIEQLKDGESWIEESLPLARTKGGGLWEPAAAPVSRRILFQTQKIERAQGNDYIAAGTLTDTTQYAGRAGTVVLTTQLEISGVEFRPSFEDHTFDIALKIPNGTPVDVEDRRQFKFEWRDGHLEKRIDENSVASLEGNFFLKPRFMWRLLVLGATLGAAVIIWFVSYRVRRARAR